MYHPRHLAIISNRVIIAIDSDSRNHTDVTANSGSWLFLPSYFHFTTAHSQTEGTNMLLWERKCPFYVERKYNSLHTFLSLHTYITDCKQIQWFPINFFGPSNANYYKESNGTRIMKCTQVLDGKKDQKPLFRYEKVLNSP